jgi:hypothetical protein
MNKKQISKLTDDELIQQLKIYYNKEHKFAKDWKVIIYLQSECDSRELIKSDKHLHQMVNEKN